MIQPKPEGLDNPITVRVDGHTEITSDDTIYLTPQSDQVHRFDYRGGRIYQEIA